MNDNTTTRRGRKAGSSDSILLTVAELNKRFNPNTQIPVRRTWLEKMAVAAALAAVVPTPAEPPVAEVPAEAVNDGLPANMEAVEAEVAAAAEVPATEEVAEKVQWSVS